MLIKAYGILKYLPRAGSLSAFRRHEGISVCRHQSPTEDKIVTERYWTED